MERDLTGRCGTCAFFAPWQTDESGAAKGDCRIWKTVKPDSATCPSHKPVGTSWDRWTGRSKPAAGTPKRLREEASAPAVARRPLPQEIDIDMDQDEFRRVLREVLRDELGLGDAEVGERWAGGELVLVPGKKDTAEKRVPLDAFFHKIVMVRDRLRVLEQKINGSDRLSSEEKVALQGYITACYGSLTTFNVLFRDREDWFVGQKGAKE